MRFGIVSVSLGGMWRGEDGRIGAAVYDVIVDEVLDELYEAFEFGTDDAE